MNNFEYKQLPSDGVDRDSGGESGHLLKMILRPRETFQAGVPIHLHCPDPPRLTVSLFFLSSLFECGQIDGLRDWPY